MTGIEEGAAIVGAGTAIYGAISSASAKASAAQQDAALKNEQADELLSREAVNEQLIQTQSTQSQLEYGAGAASMGREGGGIGGILQIQKNTAITMANSQRDAQFKAQMLRAGANIATNLASDELTSSYVTGAGTLLTGAAKAASLYKPASSKTDTLFSGPDNSVEFGGIA